MADNIAITPGSGATVATDDVGGVQYQRVKPAVGADGVAVDVSAANPMPSTVDSGTLMQRIEALLMTMRQILASAAGQMPDSSGRTRVTVETFAVGAGLGTVTTVSSVATVTKLSQIGQGGLAADMMLYAQSNDAALALRNRITVT